MTIRVQIMSDLHLSYPGARGFPPLAAGTDLVLICGDTCEGLVRALEAMRAAYPIAEIVALAGNHEFYGTAYDEELRAGRLCARELGVHLLENKTEMFGCLRIIGATLWTDYALLGESFRIPAMREAFRAMRDHKEITWRKTPWARFRPREARMLHLTSRDYIESELGRSHDGPTLVMTHHAPLLDAIEPNSRGELITAAYASDLGPLIDRYQPDYWISGHTHFPMDLIRGRTRLISNPCGYAREIQAFDPAFTIEFDA